MLTGEVCCERPRPPYPKIGERNVQLSEEDLKLLDVILPPAPPPANATSSAGWRRSTASGREAVAPGQRLSHRAIIPLVAAKLSEMKWPFAEFL